MRRFVGIASPGKVPNASSDALSILSDLDGKQIEIHRGSISPSCILERRSHDLSAAMNPCSPSPL